MPPLTGNLQSLMLLLRACLHGVGDPGLLGLVSFLSRSGGHKTKETYPTSPGSPTPCKQGLRLWYFPSTTQPNTQDNTWRHGRVGKLNKASWRGEADRRMTRTTKW